MIRTTIKRLLSHLHRAVFDTSAEEVRLFRVSKPQSGLSFTVSEDVLTVTVLPAGTFKFTYSLEALTVGQLASALVLDGFTVTGLRASLADRNARILLEGVFTSEPGNELAVMGFTDDLRVIMGAYATMIRDARAAVAEALSQMVIGTSSGTFLAYWGKLFGIVRPAGMSDPDYAKLIPKEAFRIRVNAYAIENTIKDLTGYEVTIEEPWTDIFRLDYSRFDSDAMFYDQNSVGYFLIKPVSYQTIPPQDWTEKIIPIIERNKAAGVDIMTPEPRMRYYVSDPLDGTIWTSVWDMRIAFVAFNEYYRLDEMRFDEPIDLAMHYKVAITSSQVMFTPKERILGRVYGFGLRQWDAFFMHYTGYQMFFGGLGTRKVAFTQAYPEVLKTWRDAGKWNGFQTWSKPYEVFVFFNQYKEENKFFLDGSDVMSNAQAWTVISSGTTWETPPSWDTNDTWGDGVNSNTP